LIDKIVEYLQVDFRGAYSERITLYISYVLGTHLARYSMTTGDDFPGIKAVRFWS